MSNIFDILYPKPATVVGGTYQLAEPLPAPPEVAPPIAATTGGGSADPVPPPPGPGAPVVPQGAQANAYENAFIFDQNLVDSGVEQWPPSRGVGPDSGSTASLVAPTGPTPVPPHRGEFYVQLDGVAGFSDADVGGSLVVTGAAQANFNIVYTIFQINDPTTIVLFGNVGSGVEPTPPDANNGAISWEKIALGGNFASVDHFGGIAPAPVFPFGYVQLDDVDGFTGSETGTVTLSGASQSAVNNQVWDLFEVLGATSIVLKGNTQSPGIATPDANNGAIVWVYRP